MVRGKFVGVDVEFCETRTFVICRLVILVAFDPRDLYWAAPFRCELMDKREQVGFAGLAAGGSAIDSEGDRDVGNSGGAVHNPVELATVAEAPVF